MKIFLIESVAATPHLETSGEIAIRLKKEGHDVSFYYIGNNLPWNDWDLTFIAKFLGGSFDKKIIKFCELLKKNKIKIGDNNIKVNKEKVYNWSKKFDGNLEQLKKYKYDGSILGSSVASSLISQVHDVNVDVENNINKVSNLLYSSALIYERCKKLIIKNRPDKIFTFNNRFATTYPIICAAKKLKINICIHERGSDISKFEIYPKDAHNINLIQKKILFYWRNNKDKNKFKNANNYFLKKKQGKNFNKKNLVNYKKNQIKNYLPILPTNKRIVSFFTSRDYEKASIVDQEFNQKKYFEKFKKIIKKFNDIHLVIRVHPTFGNLKSDDDKEWSKHKSKNVTVITSQEKVDSYALMMRSDIVATYTSSIIVEAAYFGKPSISIGHFWWNGMNIVEEPKTESELKKILNKNYKFKKKNKIGCLKVSNYFLNYGIKYKYYSPISNSKGKFLGQILTWKPHIIQNIEKYIRKF